MGGVCGFCIFSQRFNLIFSIIFVNVTEISSIDFFKWSFNNNALNYLVTDFIYLIW